MAGEVLLFVIGLTKIKISEAFINLLSGQRKSKTWQCTNVPLQVMPRDLRVWSL